MVTVKYKMLHPKAQCPKKGTQHAAGADVCCVGDFVLYGNSTLCVPTGLAVEVPVGYEMQVRSRSGLAAKASVFVLNSPGTIDADYRGEVKVILHNAGDGPMYFKAGERIAQLVVQAVPEVVYTQVDELSDTERGAGGFGSTGS